jgi:hypothetical protein
MAEGPSDSEIGRDFLHSRIALYSGARKASRRSRCVVFAVSPVIVRHTYPVRSRKVRSVWLYNGGRCSTVAATAVAPLRRVRRHPSFVVLFALLFTGCMREEMVPIAYDYC